ncbi:MAG: HlyD family efflux transporter periplasmic adaptor subunit [Planctomycetes bacterium]|nr:HlyD family efflux transporter periplasmic adaptor subunit [Planctomycetota bacterium]
MAIRNTTNQSAFTRRGQFSVGPLTLVTLLSFTVVSGGYWWWISQSGDQGATNAILHTMTRDNFVLEVIERGEIQSAGLNEVRSLVKSKNTAGVAILRIVPEGTEVQEGDFLVELDSSALKEERTTQQIVVTQVEALVIEARNLYETAQIAKREYLDGIYVQEHQTIESEVFVAEENLNRAKEYYKYSKKLAAKGYVNELQLEADQFAVEKSAKELEAAKTKLLVLDEYTKAKTSKQLDSDIAITNAKWEAQKHSYELELAKLQDLEEQIGQCMIVAPRDGIVLYAHEKNRYGDNNFIVEEGAMVRERQAIIRLPDPTSMEVVLTINESLIQYVKKGMPVKVKPVGLGDLVLKGRVKKVNQYAEPSGWRKANVKEYKAFVTIDNPSPELRAGLTASVVIRCAQVRNALQTPVQAVYSHGNQFYCFVFGDGRWEARKVECGPTNDRFFVIESGLGEGDRIALNPRRYLDQVRLPELPPEQQQRAVPQPPNMLTETAAGGA